MIGSVIERSGSDLTVGLKTGIHAFGGKPGGMLLLIDPDPQHRGYRLNDATAGLDSGLWVGTMTPDSSAPGLHLLRVHPDGILVADQRCCISDSPALRPTQD